jgi:hypothetical protein
VIFDVIVGVVAGPMTSIGQFPTNVGTLGSVGAKYEVSSYSGSGSLIRRGIGPKVFKNFFWEIVFFWDALFSKGQNYFLSNGMEPKLASRILKDR